MLAPTSLDAGARSFYMDALNRWYDDLLHSPVGSVLSFVLILLARFAVDQWGRHRAQRKHPKRKGHANG